MPNDPSMIVAVVSLFVAVLAALFTAYQAIISRQHNKMSVRPYLTIDRTFWLSRDGIYTARITLENTGLGPAIINYCKVFFDLNELGSSDEIQLCIEGIDEVLKEHEMSSFERYMFSRGQVIPPGKKTRIVATNMEPATKQTGKPLWVLIRRFDLCIEYQSIYGDRYNLDSRKDSPYYHSLALGSEIKSADPAPKDKVALAPPL